MNKSEDVDAAPMHGIVIWQRAGLTMDEASEAIKKLGEAAVKVPVPDRKTLRLILMNAYRMDLGPLRFFHPGWWDVFLSR
jgi:hypothetical protein